MQVDLLNTWLSKVCLKNGKITFNLWIYANFCNGALKFLMHSRNMKRNSTSKNKRSWNLCRKANLTIIFWAILIWVISIADLILKFYIWVPNIIIKATMGKRFGFKQHFSTTSKCLTQKIMILIYRNIFFLVDLTMLAPS